MAEGLKVLVLAGGPDRERPVSLSSGKHVAKALREAGHEVLQGDVLPNDISIFDDYKAWGGEVVFPVLHGPWGEGGPLQNLLEARGMPFVGTRAAEAAICMDKPATKRVLQEEGLPTPDFQVIDHETPLELDPPLVLKPPAEGSSIDLVICRTRDEAEHGRKILEKRHRLLLAESYILGAELTVGVLDGPGGPEALPAIQIIPAAEFYDYDAKYERHDTQYRFDIDLPGDLLAEIRRLALATHQALGCKHLSRVDFMADGAEGKAYILEVNTMPGFTDHSLLPKAAAQAGLTMPMLCDRLVREAIGEA